MVCEADAIRFWETKSIDRFRRSHFGGCAWRLIVENGWIRTAWFPDILRHHTIAHCLPLGHAFGTVLVIDDFELSSKTGWMHAVHET